MKNKLLFASFMFLLLLLTVNSVKAYSIHTSWQEDVSIESINGAHVITTQGNLESKVWMSFNIDGNYTAKHPSITIYFAPFEHSNNAPITNVSVTICDRPQGYGSRYDTGYSGACSVYYPFDTSTYKREGYFVSNGIPYLTNYTEYQFTFVPAETEHWQGLIFAINYTVPSFIFKQGDYSVAWLSLQNMQDKPYQVTNGIFLPTKDDIPRFLPDAQKTLRYSYIEDGKLQYRWGFVFEGGNDQIIWYWNEAETQAKVQRLQEKYTNTGIRIGFFLSLILAIVILFLERLFFDWSPWGNKLLSFFTRKLIPQTIVGNKQERKYHSLACPYVDNIDSKNRVVFENKTKAEKENYGSCSKCLAAK